MKFNWGTGILIAIILFMAVIIYTVIYIMNQDVELVTDNYYEKTLVYQDEIDKQQRSRLYESEVSLEQTGSGLILKFPEAISDQVTGGELYFYRPSKASLDFTLPVELDSAGWQRFNSDKIPKGFWAVSIRWNMGGDEYLVNKKLSLN